MRRVLSEAQAAGMHEPAAPCASFGCAVECEAQFAPVGRLTGHLLALPLALGPLLALAFPFPLQDLFGPRLLDPLPLGGRVAHRCN
eukprot:11483871-Heterocapsa_arctica.AAC.1